MKLAKWIIWISIAIIVDVGIWYLWLPPLSVRSNSFWGFLVVSAILLTIAIVVGTYDWHHQELSTGFAPAISLGVCIVLLLAWCIGSAIGAPMFNAKAHHALLDVEDTVFEQEFENVDWNTVPQIDKASSQILGSREMGTLTDEVSQYDVLDTYTLINYQGSPVRVSPLSYSGFFKYRNNKERGIPGYILVNCVTKNAEFIRMDEGMRYSPYAYFKYDLRRHLRLKYPTVLFDDFHFEISEEGTPFWVVPTYQYTKVIGKAKKPTGCILVDPVNGDTQRYALEEIPEWIDHSMTAELATSLTEWWGKFENGWFNSWVTQQGVKTSTSGYNYVTMHNDVYLYTGITSVALDESNIGFILINMRTAKAKYFEMPSAEEYSAMDSAKGQVQHLGYTSTFPILLNLDGHATYFLSLKDGAGLVKMYALVSVNDIQKLVVTDASLGVKHLENEFKKLIGNSNKSEVTESSITFVITKVYTAVMQGNTLYYFEDTQGNVYMTDISLSVKLPVYKPGDEVTITYSTTDIQGFFSILTIE